MLPKAPREQKGSTRELLRNTYGTPTDVLRISYGDARQIQGTTVRAPPGNWRAGVECPERFPGLEDGGGLSVWAMAVGTGAVVTCGGREGTP